MRLAIERILGRCVTTIGKRIAVDVNNFCEFGNRHLAHGHLFHVVNDDPFQAL